MAYNRRSVADTAIYHVKQLFGSHLTRRDYDAQVEEAMAMLRALNKITRAGMPESVRIGRQETDKRMVNLHSIYSTKPN
ncbi:Uncharacterised protein [Serratia fonticola]|uniref:Uncharacterized protein n=1 Tax=Serratia fonticola TaxID=47917 RepID=A0A4U9VKN1_SERFO|nr:Uncharacterised protein [Serratia fonticola]VTR43911.1 Uncharacterised protein [Serratia fonticola]